MPTLKTKATYQNGVVIPKTQPHFGQPDEVVVTFVKNETKKNSNTGNGRTVLAALEKVKGVLPENFLDGAKYIRTLRKQTSKEWERKIPV